MEQFNEIEKVIEKYLANEEEPFSNCFLGGVSEEIICKVESRLEVLFPESYKLFLKKFGSGGIGGMMFWGIEDKKESIERYTVVAITEEYRKKGLPHNLIVFEENGDYISCLETDKMNTNNECPVVTWSVYDEDGIVFLEEDFSSYFLSRVEEYV